MAVVGSFSATWNLQTKRQITSAAFWCSEIFGCNSRVGSIWTLALQSWALPHLRVVPQDLWLSLAGPACSAHCCLQWEALGDCCGCALYASGLVTLASLSLAYYFSLAVLQGPIWSCFCSVLLPPFSISFTLSLVTCRIAQRFMSHTERYGEVLPSQELVCKQLELPCGAVLSAKDTELGSVLLSGAPSSAGQA